jgi:hypothetical protein
MCVESSLFYSASCFLGLFIVPEDGGSVFLRNVINFYQSTRHNIPKGGTIRCHRPEKLKYHSLTSVLYLINIIILEVLGISMS